VRGPRAISVSSRSRELETVFRDQVQGTVLVDPKFWQSKIGISQSVFTVEVYRPYRISYQRVGKALSYPDLFPAEKLYHPKRVEGRLFH
jgi:hypothetical protein